MSKTPELITVMVVGPRKLDVVAVPADYREFNRLVADGSIASCPLPEGLRQRGFYAYCDDDGLQRGLPTNGFATHFGHFRLVGPIVLYRSSAEGDEQSLSAEDVAYLLKYFTRPPSYDARVQAAQDQAFWNAHPSGIAIGGLDADVSVRVPATFVAKCHDCAWEIRPGVDPTPHVGGEDHTMYYAIEG